ncbi:head maturation protease, ClpP-related [Hyphomicrobium sp. 802]|uniref:head maturation protease, ClpP-related n=1 Tax=Hyphomicrobium sp. 802 TaxID=1112272 RepID=UPI00045EBD09|nr:head maturation protease, ClpP-related [Hyphomicrobium sp. 802]
MNVLVDGEIVLYGTVGDSYWSDGFSSMDVIEALASLGRDSDVTVRINSGGGVAWEGAAIFNALNAHRGKVTVYIDAIAASAASIIAMAGDEVVMRVGSLMMIHDPSTITYGDAADHQKSIEVLSKLAAQMASIYAEKTGESAEAMREVMRVETWLTADEAVAQKFADKSDQAQAEEVTAFDYRVYAHAPAQLTALASERNWKPKQKEPAMSDKKAKPTASAEETPAANPSTEPAEKETPAADPSTDQSPANADARATERKRIAAILQAPEAKGREQLAAHFAYETDFAPAAAIAAMATAPTASATEPARASAPGTVIAGLELAAPVASAKKDAPALDHTAIYAARR